MIGNPTLYGTPDFAPPNLPKPLPARESIRWFTDLIDQSKKGKKRGRKPVADASVDEPAHDAPVSRRARSVRPAKDSAASSAVSAPAVSAGEPSGRMAPPRKSTRPRMRSESRQPSPGSSTLRETPLSAASTPPPSPSAASTTSHAVPAPSDAEAEDVLPVQNRKKGKAAAKPSGQARRSALKPTLAGVLDGDSSVPEEDVTVSRSEEWGYDGTCYYFASEGIGNDSWLTYCSSGPDAEVVLDAVEDIANLQDGLGVGLEDDGGGADDHGLEGAPAQRRSLRLAPGSRARAHASTALKAPMPPPAPLVPPAPTRPTTPILSATYLPLSVPVLSGMSTRLDRDRHLCNSCHDQQVHGETFLGWENASRTGTMPSFFLLTLRIHLPRPVTYGRARPKVSTCRTLRKVAGRGILLSQDPAPLLGRRMFSPALFKSLSRRRRKNTTPWPRWPNHSS